MTDSSKLSDIDIVKKFYKVDDKMAQKLIDEGVDIEFLKGNVNPFTKNITNEVDGMAKDLKKTLTDIINEFNP